MKAQMMMNEFLVGQIVRFTRNFLRSTGMQIGAPIDGRIEGFDKGLNFPLVLWNNSEEAVPVNPANIELCP